MENYELLKAYYKTSDGRILSGKCYFVKKYIRNLSISADFSLKTSNLEKFYIKVCNELTVPTP